MRIPRSLELVRARDALDDVDVGRGIHREGLALGTIISAASIAMRTETLTLLGNAQPEMRSQAWKRRFTRGVSRVRV